jgi:hypothetical protein
MPGFPMAPHRHPTVTPPLPHRYPKVSPPGLLAIWSEAVGWLDGAARREPGWAQAAILIMAKALGKQVIAALVRLQNQRGMVSGNARS